MAQRASSSEMERTYIDAPPALVELGITRIEAIGNVELVTQGQMAVIWEYPRDGEEFPSSLMDATHDIAKRWREKDLCVVSRYETLFETIVHIHMMVGLTRPKLINCRANALPRHNFHAGYREIFAAHRLLMLTTSSKPSVTKTSNLHCLHLVAALAPVVFIPYAASNSELMKLARTLLAQGKEIQTFQHPRNEQLLSAGAVAVDLVKPTKQKTTVPIIPANTYNFGVQDNAPIAEPEQQERDREIGGRLQLQNETSKPEELTEPIAPLNLAVDAKQVPFFEPPPPPQMLPTQKQASLYQRWRLWLARLLDIFR